MTKLSEQETVIGKAADEDSWNVWSTDPRMIRWLNRHGERLQMTVIGSGRKGGPWLEVQIPADRVRMLVPRQAKRPPDEEQKEAVRARMRHLAAIRSRGMKTRAHRDDSTPEAERRNSQHYEQETAVD